SSINPDTGKAWGAHFPMIVVEDWVNSQARLADHLCIRQWAAVVGGSLGGMQALQWAIAHPDRLRHCVAIATASKLSAQDIALNVLPRQPLLGAPALRDGDGATHVLVPKHGVGLARMVVHIPYLGDDAMGQKFGRELRSDEQN